MGGQTYRYGQEVAASQLLDLADVTEGSAHDEGFVAVFFEVVVDGVDPVNAGVVLGVELLLVHLLVPVEDAADKGRDNGNAGLGGGNGLHLAEYQRHVAVDAVLGLEDFGGLDALPRRSNFDENAAFVDPELAVNLSGVVVVRLRYSNNYSEKKKKNKNKKQETRDSISTYLDDSQSLVDGALDVKREPGVDFRGHSPGDVVEDILAAQDQEIVQGSIDSFVRVTALPCKSVSLSIQQFRLITLAVLFSFSCRLFITQQTGDGPQATYNVIAVFDSRGNATPSLRLPQSNVDQSRVCGGILWLEFGDF